MKPHRTFTRLLGTLLGATLLGACSPALNWRDARPEGTSLLLTFPCKPQQIAQDVVLAGRNVHMSMTGCVAAGMTFALAHARLDDAASSAAALDALRQSAVANLDGRVGASHPVQVGRDAGIALDIDGRSPQAEAMREHVVLFAHGADAYQATTFGSADAYKDDAAQMFAESIRMPDSK
jgi:hypothetical protein